MTKLLYIQASPRGAKSNSVKIADAYLEVLRKQHPDVDVDTIHLWEENLPSFGEVQANAKIKLMMSQSLEGAEKVAWAEITEISKRFIGADRYLFAVPMWNGGIPYRLKHYIDIVHQPGLTWGIDAKTGFFGLLKNKHATVMITSGAYYPGAPVGFGPDYQSSYMRDWLHQAGVEAVDEVRFQPTILTSDPTGGLEKSLQAATSLADRHVEELKKSSGSLLAEA